MKYLNYTVIILSFFLSSLLSAKEIDLVTTFNYESSWNSEPSDSDQKKAQLQAKEQLWKKYISEMDQAQIDQYLLLQEEIDSEIDEYILDFYIKESKVDEDAKTITLFIRAEINEALLFGKLKNQSAAGQTSSQEGSNIGYLITLRKEINRQQYQDRDIDITEETDSINSSMNETENSSSESSTKVKKTVAGGSEKIKSDVSAYEKTNQTIGTDELDAGFLSVFSSFGFEVSKYAVIEGFCGGVPQEDVENEFIQKNKISNKNKIGMLKAAKDCEMNYFVTGAMTIQKAGRQKGTSNTETNVSLSVEVTAIPKKGPPKSVASFIEQVSEVGSTERASAIKAIKKVSEITAKKIVDQLNSKGIN
jgi:hypothetical protein